jgi:hypothetical protein
VSSRLLRLGCACAVVLGAVLVAPSASADLRVKWDCDLPNTAVDCALLESSLTSKIPFIKIVATPFAESASVLTEQQA